MKYTSFAIIISAMVVMASSCTGNNPSNQEVFFDKSGMDTTIKPGDNFFLYANGSAIAKIDIPADKSSWGTFRALAESNLNDLKSILENAQKQEVAKGSIEQKLGGFYESGLDTLAIEAKGATPILPMLAKIDSIKNYKGLMNLVAGLSLSGEQKLIGFRVGADEKNSSQNIFNVRQTGLSLPEKGYYIRTDSITVHARKALVDYATKLFSLTGNNQAQSQKKAQTILNIETILSKFHRSPVELRNPQLNYNKFSTASLETAEPNINWQNLFSRLNLKVDSVNIGQPAYYRALDSLLVVVPIESWKAKLAFDYIKSNASFLSKPFTSAEFKFESTLNGKKKDAERWKKVTHQIDRGLGELLGQLYVKKYFPPASKARMVELVSNLQKAYKARIVKLDWMGDSTKQKAILKLNSFLKKIGYPDKWKKYDDVTIDKNNYFANAQSVRKHRVREMLDKYGKPVDRTEWWMTTPTVNAYYNPSNNEIVFPAGILQFPFFNANADDAINYGGIGMVIGHEMTHGFDDQGSQYDDKGNLKNWWTASDRKKFDAKTGVVVAQYNAFTILDSIHVNGSLTLGENLADIGGLAIAYDAFKMTPQGKGEKKINGLTPDQRFFLSYAQVWRSKSRPANMRTRIKTDPHSPAIWRVNGAVYNFEPFYKAFDVKPGDKMYIAPEARAKVW